MFCVFELCDALVCNLCDSFSRILVNGDVETWWFHTAWGRGEERRGEERRGVEQRGEKRRGIGSLGRGVALTVGCLLLQWDACSYSWMLALTVPSIVLHSLPLSYVPLHCLTFPSIVLHSLPLSYIPFHCLTFPSIVLHSLLGADTTLFGKQNTRKPESVSTFWSAGLKKVGGAKKQRCPEPVFYKPAGFINLRWPLMFFIV